MARRRRERPSLADEEGTMAIMQIPGHDHQKPREVTLEEIRAVLGDCRRCPLAV